MGMLDHFDDMLNKTVTIKRKVETETDSAGVPSSGGEVNILVDEPCRLSELSARDQMAWRQLASVRTHRLYVGDNATGVKPYDRAYVDDREFEVVAVNNVGEESDFCQIDLREVQLGG